MRIVRMSVAATVIGFVLGCSGLTESLTALSGADIQVGDNVALPADFPLTPPPGSNVTAVMSLPAGGAKTTTVTAEVPGDGAGLLDQYEQQMQAKGLTVTRTKTGQGDTITGQMPGGSEFLSATVSTESGSTQLILVTVTGAGGGSAVPMGEPPAAAIPAGGEPPPAEVPAQ